MSADSESPDETRVSGAEAGGQTRDTTPGEALAADALCAVLKEELAPALEVVRPLGSGTMALVYLAREGVLRRMVAIKVLRPELARERTAALRFEREGQAVASISHPNVLPVYRVDRLRSGVPYLVLPYVRGRSLAERLEADGPLDPKEAAQLLAQVASALAAAHRQGVVHRDIKPANVLLESETGRIFLTDFGLASILVTGSDAPLHLTQTGEVIGSVGYLSPEQMAGGPLTEQVDVFGLGVLAYEVLTGVNPFAGTAGSSAAAVPSVDPPPLSDLRPEISPHLEDLVRRCLARTPSARPAAADLARRLAEQPASAPSARSESASRRLAAVFFADLVGYTRLSASDQQSALEQVSLLQEVASATVPQYGGRIVKFIGDAVLAQFGSAAGGTEAALAVMRDFTARSAETGVATTLRIGVHLGDVTTSSDGDVYGEGINLAARLQAAAAPRQILASVEVCRQLRSRKDLQFRPLGARLFKGLDEPVDVFVVTAAEEAGRDATGLSLLNRLNRWLARLIVRLRASA